MSGKADGEEMFGYGDAGLTREELLRHGEEVRKKCVEEEALKQAAKTIPEETGYRAVQALRGDDGLPHE
jgi:hypothetical protein